VNWNRKPVKPPQDPNRPKKLMVHGLQEFQNAVVNADEVVKVNGVWERGKRGKYTIVSVTPFGPGTGNGGRKGRYELELSWHEPLPLEQSELL
jgi:hypothetical protein